MDELKNTMNFLLEVDQETKRELKTFLGDNKIGQFEIFQKSFTIMAILGITLASLQILDIIHKWVQERKQRKPDMVINIKIDNLNIDLKNPDIEQIKKQLQNNTEIEEI